MVNPYESPGEADPTPDPQPDYGGCLFWVIVAIIIVVIVLLTLPAAIQS